VAFPSLLVLRVSHLVFFLFSLIYWLTQHTVHLNPYLLSEKAGNLFQKKRVFTMTEWIPIAIIFG